MRVTLTILCALILGLFTSGCSLVGLGIGAAVPKYSEPDPASQIEMTRIDDEPASHAKSAPVATDPPREATRKRVGSYWATGLGVGFLVDVVLVVTVLVAGTATHGFGFGNWHSMPTGAW